MAKSPSSCRLLVFVFALFVCGAKTSCPGTATNLPITDATSMVLAANVTNGQMFTAGPSDNSLRVVHVWGTAYEMGYAQGLLLGAVLRDVYSTFVAYVEALVEADIKDKKWIQFLPLELRTALESATLVEALELTFKATRQYTPQHFFDEIQGFADGAGVDASVIIHLNMIPELVKAACSMLGAWGPATSKSTAGLIQLRALDWGLDSPLVRFHQLTVYHPSDGTRSFATMGWTGFVGAITGYSQDIAVSEKVWLGSTDKTTRFGIPWNFMLRDVLQFDVTLDDATNRMSNGHRTCDVIFGVGSTSDGEVRVYDYSAQELLVFDDMNYPVYDGHPRMQGLVYVDRHVQPSKDTCMSSILQNLHGAIDAPTIIHQLLASTQSGDMHTAVYDFAANTMYVGMGQPTSTSNGTVVLPAYSRPFLSFNMTVLLGYKQ